MGENNFVSFWRKNFEDSLNREVKNYSKEDKIEYVKTMINCLQLSLDDIRGCSGTNKLTALNSVPLDVIPLEIDLVEGKKITLIGTEPVLTCYEDKLDGLCGDIINVYVRNRGEEEPEDFLPPRRIFIVKPPPPGTVRASSIKKFIIPTVDENYHSRLQSKTNQEQSRPGTSREHDSHPLEVKVERDSSCEDPIIIEDEEDLVSSNKNNGFSMHLEDEKPSHDKNKSIDYISIDKDDELSLTHTISGIQTDIDPSIQTGAVAIDPANHHMNLSICGPQDSTISMLDAKRVVSNESDECTPEVKDEVNPNFFKNADLIQSKKDTRRQEPLSLELIKGLPLHQARGKGVLKSHQKNAPKFCGSPVSISSDSDEFQDNLSSISHENQNTFDIKENKKLLSISRKSKKGLHSTKVEDAGLPLPVETYDLTQNEGLPSTSMNSPQIPDSIPRNQNQSPISSESEECSPTDKIDSGLLPTSISGSASSIFENLGSGTLSEIGSSESAGGSPSSIIELSSSTTSIASLIAESASYMSGSTSSIVEIGSSITESARSSPFQYDKQNNLNKVQPTACKSFDFANKIQVLGLVDPEYYIESEPQIQEVSECSYRPSSNSSVTVRPDKDVPSCSKIAIKTCFENMSKPNEKRENDKTSDRKGNFHENVETPSHDLSSNEAIKALVPSHKSRIRMPSKLCQCCQVGILRQTSYRKKKILCSKGKMKSGVGKVKRPLANSKVSERKKKKNLGKTVGNKLR